MPKRKRVPSSEVVEGENLHSADVKIQKIAHKDEALRRSKGCELVASIEPSFPGLLSPIGHSATTPTFRNELEGNPQSIEQSRCEEEQTLQHRRQFVESTLKNLRTFVQRNYRRLKSNIESEEVADFLYQKEVLSSDERQTIHDIRTLLAKNEYLIRCIVKYLQKTESVAFIAIFKEAMKRTESEHLLKDFENVVSELGHDTDRNLLHENKAWTRTLDVFLHRKKGEINPVDILDHLLEVEAITFDEYENVKTIDYYPRKLQCLIEYLKEKTVKEYDKFVSVIKEEYPAHVDGFNEEYVMDAENDDSSVQIDLREVHVTSYNHADSASDLDRRPFLKLTSDDSCKEIEQHVVNKLQSQENADLYRQAVEFAANGIRKIQFSSIRLTLKNLSSNSQMLVYTKCKTSPEYLKMFLKAVLKEDDVLLYHQKGIYNVHVEINIPWQDCTLTKRIVAANFCFLKENIPDIFKLKTDIHGINAETLESLKTKSERNAAFLLQVVNSSEDDLVIQFYNALKTNKANDILKNLTDDQHEISRTCFCRLSKDLLTKHFTKLAEGMSNLKDILKRYLDFHRFHDDDRVIFQMQLIDLQCSEDCISAKQNEAFLRQILKMQCDQFEICLLEEALHESKQEELTKQVLIGTYELKDGGTDFILEKDDIIRNQQFLINELEPSRFLVIFENEPKILASIKSALNRKERCNILLEALKGNQSILKKFGVELNSLHRHRRIIQIFIDGRKQGSFEERLTKDDIRRNAGFLIEEVDPRKFLKMLRDVKLRGVKNSDAVIEKILSSTPRRQRSISFIQFLQDGPNSDTAVLELFERELKDGESSKETCLQKIYNFLINSRENDPYQQKIKEAVISQYSNIVDEVEVDHLRPMFTERGVLASEDFDVIMRKYTARRDKTTMLLDSVLDGRPSRAHCLLNAMEAAGYSSLAQKIRTDSENFHSCPRLFKARHCEGDGFTVEGDIDLKVPNKMTFGDGSLRLPLHKVDRRTFTADWVKMCTDENENGRNVKTASTVLDNNTLSVSSHSHEAPLCTIRKQTLRRAKKCGVNCDVDSRTCKCFSPQSWCNRNIDECFDAGSNSVRSLIESPKGPSSTCTESTMKYTEDD